MPLYGLRCPGPKPTDSLPPAPAPQNEQHEGINFYVSPSLTYFPPLPDSDVFLSELMNFYPPSPTYFPQAPPPTFQIMDRRVRFNS